MTCILGVEHGEKVLLAGDSGAWSTNENDVMRVGSPTPKVQKWKGVVVGYAGSVGLAQRFVRRVLAHDGLLDQEDLLRAVDQALEDHKDDDDSFGALVGVGSILWSVGSDGHVLRPVGGYQGIGSSGYAVGHFIGETGNEMARRTLNRSGMVGALRRALKCQAEHSSSCVPPFVVRST